MIASLGGDLVAVVAAVPEELAPLADALEAGSQLALGRARQPASRGTLAGREVILCASGLGKVNAARTLACLLESQPVGAVLVTGVGGAYPGSRLRPGEVALASEEILADEGVDTPDGFRDVRTIGIPLLPGLAGNRIPLDPDLVERARQALGARGGEVRVGPFATVSTCSGTDLGAARLYERWGALVESMEGAALALVAAHYQVPLVEIRAVSNTCGDRDRGSWDLAGAVRAAEAAARRVLEVLP